MARRQRNSGNAGELGAQQVRVASAPLVDDLELAQLRPAERRGQLRHPKVEANDVRKVLFGRVIAENRLTVIENQSSTGRYVTVAGDDHPAFAGHDVLRLLEAEYAGIAHRAGPAVAPHGADGLARVLDDLQPMRVSDRGQSTHVGNVAGEVNRHDGLGPRRYGPLHRLRVDTKTMGIHVDEDGDRIRTSIRRCRWR